MLFITKLLYFQNTTFSSTYVLCFECFEKIVGILSFDRNIFHNNHNLISLLIILEDNKNVTPKLIIKILL